MTHGPAPPVGGDARPLFVETLSVASFRNLSAVDLWPSPRFNVLSGPNGAGKTSVLEALYVVASSRSFRATRPGELVAHGAPEASVRARVVEDGVPREQSLGLRPGLRLARVDGKRPSSLAAYAVQTPVVVFHPNII